LVLLVKTAIRSKKAIDTIKKIGDLEERIANNIIHKITREIVNRAIETDSLIVLGKLKGLRNREKKEGRGRGRKFNRKLSGFLYFKFTDIDIDIQGCLGGYQSNQNIRELDITNL